MTELRPCPFCGGTDIHIVENGPDGFSITCKDCNVWVDNIFEDMTEEQAIEQWNKRYNNGMVFALSNVYPEVKE